MSKTRDEHLAWCKERALAEIDGDNFKGAVASMQSDLLKWDGEPLYDRELLQTLMADGLMFRNTPESMREWVNGFN